MPIFHGFNSLKFERLLKIIIMFDEISGFHALWAHGVIVANPCYSVTVSRNRLKAEGINHLVDIIGYKHHDIKSCILPNAPKQTHSF